MENENSDKNGWFGGLAGVSLILIATAALWKNETRYDYSREAARAQVVENFEAETEDCVVAYTGPMNQDLVLAGDYVERFKGYLIVYRRAEIYAWKKKRRNKRDVWEKSWTGSLSSNSRNSNIRQTLSSTEFFPSVYQVGEIDIDTNEIQFVDSDTSIDVRNLKLTNHGRSTGLKVNGQYFYLDKGTSEKLGDERLSFTGILVPTEATYFGKCSDGKGVPFDENRRDDMISSIIQDSGILHHVVGGDRSVALSSMKQHFAMVKWAVRGIGSIALVIGWYILFASVAKFLFTIPVIGTIAAWGAMILALVIGGSMAIVVMSISFLVSHPIWLAAFSILSVAGAYLLIKRVRATNRAVKSQLSETYGKSLDLQHLEKLELKELVHLALSDGRVDESEREFLDQWAKKKGMGPEQVEAMIDDVVSQQTKHDGSSQANSDHLHNLILLAMADGSVSNREMNTIREMARRVGFDSVTISELEQSIRDEVQEKMSMAK